MPDVTDVREVIKEMKMKSEAAVAEPSEPSKPSEPSEPSEPADKPAIDQWVGDSTEVVEFFKGRQRWQRDQLRVFAAKQGRSLLGPQMQMPGANVRRNTLTTIILSFPIW